MRELIVATHNKGKREELARLLRPHGIEPVTLSQAGIDFSDVEETGDTFEENARIKARAAFERSGGRVCMADDSGLVVDALGGAPGVYSARYAGGNATDAQRIDKLLHALEGVELSARTAKFVCAVCCITEDGREWILRGECGGKIAFAPRGAGGFGYDPVFLIEDGRSFSELTAQEKDSISHRGAALRALVDKLPEMGLTEE